MHKFPKLIEDVSNNNKINLSSVLGLGLPYMKLDKICPDFGNDVINELITDSSDHRLRYKILKDSENYQTRQWLSGIYFGPTDADTDKFLELYRNYTLTHKIQNDTDRIVQIFRDELEFEWKLDSSHPIRKWVSTFLNDDDIYAINTFVFPAGGYLFPHADKTDGKFGLERIYIPLKWPVGCEFGVYNFGNMPVKERELWLIDQYTHIHWALNRSEEPRVVLGISCKLQKIENLIISSFEKMFN